MQKIDQKDNTSDSNYCEHFAYLLSTTQRWFSPKEMGVIIGKTAQYVRNAFDNQRILGHILNGSSPRGAEKRHTYMISREGVLLFLFETANFTPEDFIDRLVEILANRSISQLLKIQKKIDDLIAGRNTGFSNWTDC